MIICKRADDYRKQQRLREIFKDQTDHRCRTRKCSGALKSKRKKSAVGEVLKLLEQDQIDLSKCLFGYTGKDEQVLEGFYEQILEQYPFESHEKIQIGPAIGTHVGPGAKAIVYRAK